MDKEKITTYLSLASKTALLAGQKIMEVYNGVDFDIELKNDNSPLTKADRLAHEKIKEELEKTGLPLLSEEGAKTEYSERKDWKYYWLVDPLDGTKEFIKRNGEFTVNISLVHDQKSILGVVYAPAHDVLYFGANTLGAFKIDQPNSTYFNSYAALISNAAKLPLHKTETYTVVASRSHLSQETKDYLEMLRDEHGKINTISSGSSLKLCLVAEGSADVYPRFAPTMEWDTAAGHAIVEAAGKTVIQHSSESPLLYNKKDLLNPWFIVK